MGGEIFGEEVRGFVFGDGRELRLEESLGEGRPFVPFGEREERERIPFEGEIVFEPSFKRAFEEGD